MTRGGNETDRWKSACKGSPVCKGCVMEKRRDREEVGMGQTDGDPDFGSGER